MTSEPLQAMHTVEDVAMKLRTTKWTITRWLRQGRMPGVKLAGEWRVRGSDLERIMAEGLR